MPNLSKTEIKKIMKTPGEVKGAVFQTDAAYVKEKIKELKEEPNKENPQENVYP